MILKARHPAQPWLEKADLCPGCQDCRGHERASSRAFPIAVASQPLQGRWRGCLRFLPLSNLGVRWGCGFFLGVLGMQNETNFSGSCDSTIAISMLGGKRGSSAWPFPAEACPLPKPARCGSRGGCQAAPVLRGNLLALSQPLTSQLLKYSCGGAASPSGVMMQGGWIRTGYAWWLLSTEIVWCLQGLIHYPTFGWWKFPLHAGF